ncbi:hypothetical protein [Aquimarina rhabdastrellae]
MTLQAYKKRILEHLSIEYDKFCSEQNTSLEYALLNQEINKLYNDKIRPNEAIIKVLRNANQQAIKIIQQMVSLQSNDKRVTQTNSLLD